MTVDHIIARLAECLPEPIRWAGSVARLLRQFNVALATKGTGSALTDALTLADLTVQDLLVSALRDRDPVFRTCRIEAEEETGDLTRFAATGEWVLSLDPIDGTKQYRDHTGNGYAVMLHLRNASTVVYSLLFIPEKGSTGYWVEARPGRLVCGPDDPSKSPRAVLDALTPITPQTRADGRSIYLIGFQHRDVAAAQRVSATGLVGVAPDDMPGSIYELLARGEFAGSLIHSPNVYDFPISLQIARDLGGDAVWVHNGESVHFRETWLDEGAGMLRLPGIVACSPDRDVLKTLVSVARDWNPTRYRTGDSL